MHTAVCPAAALFLVLAGCSSSEPLSVSAAVDQAGRRSSAPQLPSGTLAPPRDPLHLVVLGDPVPLGSLCFGCTGFADRYAARLEDETGRPVELANLSRVRGVGHADIRRQVAGDDVLRARLRRADVVIVSLPSGPDPEGVLAPVADAAPRSSALLALTVSRNRVGHPDLLLRGGNPHRLGAPGGRRFDGWNELACSVGPKLRFSCVGGRRAGDDRRGEHRVEDRPRPARESDDVIAELLCQVYAPSATR